VLQPLAPQFGQPADPAATAKYNEETAKQNAIRDGLVNDAEIKMVAVLTPAQAEKWEASRLNQQLTTRLGTLGWTADQKAKADPIVADFSKQLATAKDSPTLVKTKGAFWVKIAALLTDVQITQVFAPTAGGGRGGFGGGGFGGGGPGGGGGRGGRGGGGGN
jgi:hypothetical protein